MVAESVPIVSDTVVSLQAAVLSLWSSFVSVFPGIIAAGVITVVGWLVGKIVGGIVTEAFRKAKSDKWLKDHGIHDALGGIELAKLMGTITKWYVIVVFLGQVTAYIRLQALQIFLQQLVGYLPALIGAFLVLIVGLLIGEYAKINIMKVKFTYKDLMARAAKFLIVYFALVIGLETANFSVAILRDAFRIGFTALAISVAIVVGISLGFAVKTDAEAYWKKMKKK